MTREQALAAAEKFVAKVESGRAPQPGDLRGAEGGPRLTPEMLRDVPAR